MARELDGQARPEWVASPAATPGSGELSQKQLQAVERGLRAGVDGALALDLGALDGGQLAWLVRLAKGEAERLAALISRGLAQFDAKKAFQADGSDSTQGWLKDQLRVSYTEAKGQVSLAKTLRELPKTRQAFEQGQIGQRHAQVIANAVKEAPAQGREQLEGDLLALARQSDPRAVERKARAKAIYTDPDRAERHADEQFARRRLMVGTRRDGMLAVEGLLDQEGGEVLLTALNALTLPEKPDVPREAWRTPEQRRADALVELSRRALDAATLPETGGERPHVSLVVDLTTLHRLPGAPAADLSFTGPVSPQAALRLCCDASVARAITAGSSQPLDVGRRTRVVSPAQRRALEVRDKACRWCGAPPAWAQAHHLVHWAQGGATDIKNLLLLCRGCHQRVHEGKWTITLADDNTVTFTNPNGRTTIRPPP